MAGDPGLLGLQFYPLTVDRWSDLEALFGDRGACGGCWCMWWRLTRAVFKRQRGEANRKALRSLVASGEVPGILAYADLQPIGWCAVAPRDSYPVLQRSRALKPIDDKPVWAITCLFVKKAWRRKGVSVQLLRAATEYVKARGGHIVEGYPVESAKKLPDAFAWTGLVSAFQQAGFLLAARRSATRVIMRFWLNPPGARSD